MPKMSEPLTRDELERITQRRAEARTRARQIVDSISDEEVAALAAAAKADPDNPPLSGDKMSRRM